MLAVAVAATTAYPKPVAPLVFITSNENKLAEVRSVLSSGRPYLTSLNLEVPEVQEASPSDIAKAKARYAARLYPYPLIVEDTSLCFNALKGLPGAYIKWFLKDLGLEGLNDLLGSYTDKTAYAQCIFALMLSPESEPILFTGKCSGRIVPPRGSKDFGWDAIFEVDVSELNNDSTKQTFAEMDINAKNQISHRAKALEQLKSYLQTNQHLF